MSTTGTILLVLAASAAAVLSLVTILLYAADKRAALRNRRRVPERTLHVLALLGGWPGGLLAQRLFKHKRRKRRFMTGFWLAAAGHVAFVGALFYLVEVAGR